MTIETVPAAFQQRAERPLDRALLERYFHALLPPATMVRERTELIARAQQQADQIASMAKSSGLSVRFRARIPMPAYDETQKLAKTDLRRGTKIVIDSTAIGAWYDRDLSHEWVIGEVELDDDEFAEVAVADSSFSTQMASAKTAAIDVEITGEVLAVRQEIGDLSTLMMGASLRAKASIPGVSTWRSFLGAYDSISTASGMGAQNLDTRLRGLLFVLRPTGMTLVIGKSTFAYTRSAPLDGEANIPPWVDELQRPIKKVAPAKKPPLLERKQLSDALLQAAKSGDVETSVEALSEGALPNPTDDRSGWKAVDFLLQELDKSKYDQRQRVTVLETLIGYGCDVSDPMTLKVASNLRAIDLLVTVIRGGASPATTHQEPAGSTTPSPLIQAAMSGRTDVVQVLLAAGADPNETCTVAGLPCFGRRVDDIAVSEGHRDIAQMIRGFRDHGKVALFQSERAKGSLVLVSANAEALRPATAQSSSEPQARDIPEIVTIPETRGVYLLENDHWRALPRASGVFERKMDLLGAFKRGAAAKAGRTDSAQPLSGYYVVRGAVVPVSSGELVIGVRGPSELDPQLVTANMAVSFCTVPKSDDGSFRVPMVKYAEGSSTPDPASKVQLSMHTAGSAYAVRVQVGSTPVVLIDQFLNIAVLSSSGSNQN